MSIIENDKIILSRKEYKLAQEKCRIASGSEGSVYKFDNNTALKIYATKEEMEFSSFVLDKEISKVIESYIPFLKVKNFSYIFPQKLVYIEDEFAGHSMEYIKGKDLGRKIFNESFDTLKEYMNKLKIDTDVISNEKIKVYDMYLTNVIVNNGFRIIDIQPHTYKYNDNFSLQECKKNNDDALRQLLIYIVESVLVLQNVYASFYGQHLRDMLLKKYRSGINLLNNKLKKENISINEYLDLLKLELSVYSGREIENLSEARKILIKKQ